MASLFGVAKSDGQAVQTMFLAFGDKACRFAIDRKIQMEEDMKILNEIEKAKNDMNGCKTFSGAITVEIIRKYLRRNGIRISRPDVFICGVNNEIDLLVVTPEAKPKYGILYEPRDVLAVLEIKARGAIGPDAVESIKNTFCKVKKIVPQVLCCYVTIRERESYIYRITTENLGYPAYTLFFHKNENINSVTSTGDWKLFVQELNGHVKNRL